MAGVDVHMISKRANFTHRVMKRAQVSPSIVVDAVSDPTPSHAVIKPIPNSVKALAAVVVVIGVLILSLAAWRIGVWRRNKVRARVASNTFNSAVAPSGDVGKANDLRSDVEWQIEKTEVILAPAPAAPGTKWVPQSLNRLSRHAKSQSTPAFLNKVAQGTEPQFKLNVQSPPPSYVPNPDTTISPPGLGRRASPPPLDIPLPTAALMIDVSRQSVISPARSASIVPSFLKGRPSPAMPGINTPKGDSPKLPRMMTVAYSFVPSLPDELNVKVGEALQMIEEYEDEWCLVQRVGRADSDRGVVPRFCLQERQEVVPVFKSHRRGLSSIRSITAVGATHAL